MKIYVTHDKDFDYQNELYKPLRESELNVKHEITLPHEHDAGMFNSKDFMKECDLILAEVSFASTGQGIELGWGNAYGKPIICFYKEGMKSSGALKAVTDKVFTYSDTNDLITKLTDIIDHLYF